MNEIEILDKDMGGIKLRDMSAITFFTWVARKLNGAKAHDVSVVELVRLVSNPPMSRTIPNDYKLEIINKLKKINIEI